MYQNRVQFSTDDHSVKIYSNVTVQFFISFVLAAVADAL